MSDKADEAFERRWPRTGFAVDDREVAWQAYRAGWDAAGAEINDLNRQVAWLEARNSRDGTDGIIAEVDKLIADRDNLRIDLVTMTRAHEEKAQEALALRQALINLIGAVRVSGAPARSPLYGATIDAEAALGVVKP
jgi:hypothetical protein